MSKGTDDLRHIDRNELLRIVPLSYTHIWRLMRTDAFPRPRNLGMAKAGWKLSEVREWLESRPRKNYKPAA